MISIKEHKKASGFKKSYMIFSFKQVNCGIVNALRRTCLNDIPTYAFACVKPEINKSIFNNDMMKTRLVQVPIFGIDSGLHHLENKYWNLSEVNHYDGAREKHPKEVPIEAYINAVNNTTEIMNVSTRDMRYLVDNKEVDYPNKDILLIQLKPQQVFKAQLKAGLGISYRNAIWASCHCYYKQHDTKLDEFELTIESKGQIDEKTIMIKAINNIMYKLDVIEMDIKKKRKENKIDMENDKTIFILLENEDHTIGGLINQYIQENPNTLFGGYTKPDHNLQEIVFKISVKEGNPIDVFFDSLNKSKKLMKKFEQELCAKAK